MVVISVSMVPDPDMTSVIAMNYYSTPLEFSMNSVSVLSFPFFLEFPQCSFFSFLQLFPSPSSLSPSPFSPTRF